MYNTAPAHQGNNRPHHQQPPSSSSQQQQQQQAQTPKEKHYAQLAARLGSLSQNVIDLHGHVELAAEHSLKTRALAAYQASLFMAANAQELDRPNRAEEGAEVAE